jgi:hypothetical protein
MIARLPLLVALSAVIFYACEKTPEATDSCAGIGPFDIALRVTERFAADTTLATDSITLNTPVILTASQPEKGYFARYRWKIGDDPEEQTGSRLEYTFYSQRYKAGDLVRIKLIGETTVNACRPDDDGIDSIETTIRIISLQDAAIVGKYRGIFQSDRNRTDTQVVEIRHYPLNTAPQSSFRPDGTILMFNVQKGCNTPITSLSVETWDLVVPLRFGHRFAEFQADGIFNNNCLGPNARFDLKAGQRDSLVARFSYAPDRGAPMTRVNDEFRGVRMR